MDKRSKVYLGSAYQNLMLFYLTGVFLIGMVIFIGAFYILNSFFSVPFMKSFLISSAISLVIVLPLFAKVIISLTHRVAGPLYRMEKNLERMIEGERELNFKIRDKDLVKSLAAKLELLNETLRQQHSAVYQALVDAAMEAERLEKKVEADPSLPKEHAQQIRALKERLLQLKDRFSEEFLKGAQAPEG